jgi:glycosyltransferase involved in cell wall biosynthesis
MLSPAPVAAPSETPPPDGVTVLGVQFASITSLFAPLADRTELMFVHVNDWLNELRYRFRPGAFVQVQPPAGMDWREWRCPPGWANRLAPAIMPILAMRLQRAWRARGWKNPRLVVTFPYFLPLVQKLEPARTVYYAVDNYQAYWPDRAAALREQENALIRIAGASIAASSLLADWFRERVPSASAKIYQIANGVRPEMIAPIEAIKAGPAVLDRDLAQRFGDASGPVVGYYGNIDPGYGIEFLAAVVARLPEFPFLLMGRVLSDERKPYKQAIADLRKCPNVFFTGHLQEPHSLRFLRQCDVMIISLPLTEQIRYSCPNRLWTYMATGRPIVSTPIPEVTKFGDLVYIAAGVDEFVAALRDAARENDPQRMAQRLEVAKEHTWPVLAERLYSRLCLTGNEGSSAR